MRPNRKRMKKVGEMHLCAILQKTYRVPSMCIQPAMSTEKLLFSQVLSPVESYPCQLGLSCGPQISNGGAQKHLLPSPLPADPMWSCSGSICGGSAPMCLVLFSASQSAGFCWIPVISTHPYQIFITVPLRHGHVKAAFQGRGGKCD